MDRFGEQFPKSDTIASQLICHHLARLICVALEQAPEETLGCLVISARLYGYVDHFAVDSRQATSPVCGLGFLR